MDETITINELREILDISYPTALKIAQGHGRKKGNKWYIPISFAAKRLRNEIVDLDYRMGLYKEILTDHSLCEMVEHGKR